MNQDASVGPFSQRMMALCLEKNLFLNGSKEGRNDGICIEYPKECGH